MSDLRGTRASGRSDPPPGRERNTVTAAWIGAIGVLGAALIGVAGPAFFSPSVPPPQPVPQPVSTTGSESRPDNPVPQTGAPSPSPAPPSTGPVLAVSPSTVQPGQWLTLPGSGFTPGAGVTINSGAFFVAFDQADADGTIDVVVGPIDQSFCSPSPVELTALVGGRPAATTSVRFCS